MAARLMSAGSAGEKGKVMAEAERALASTPADVKKAEVYVKVMRKIVAEGAEVPGMVTISSFGVSCQLLTNDLNNVSSVSLLVTSSMALANKSFFS